MLCNKFKSTNKFYLNKNYACLLSLNKSIFKEFSRVEFLIMHTDTKLDLSPL